MVSDFDWIQVSLPTIAVSGSGFASFKQSTSTTAGSWFSGSRTLATIPSHDGVASLMVVVWDSSLSSDPFSFQAMNSLLWGRSAVFQYTTPASPIPAPAEFLMNNLRSFYIGIPEPTAPVLAGLGVTLLALFRRRQNP